jgi:hypothetical protein
VTVDVVNGTGDQAVAEDVAARLAAAGLTVGSVASADSTASGIEYPASQKSGARWLAAALGKADLLRVGDVRHVTVVLGATGSAAFVQALDTLPACAAGE